MKLRDLVANSLPRVRGRKKKTSAGTPTSTTEAAAKLEPSTACSVSDKNQNRFPSVGSRSGSRDDSTEIQGITEANWRGNALYRGLEAARAVKFNSKMMSTSYTSSHGMVTSHSADGFSSQLMMMSRSYDSRMTVPNCNESCPQMFSISETCKEPFSTPQQYYHCHYHRHNHHHYHHHHLHPQPMAPVEQNQQRLYPDPGHTKVMGSHKVPEETKAEPGFFRKSFAAFGGIRKHSSKTNKDTKTNGAEKMVCSVCPYPGTVITSIDKQSTEKRASKPKRKSLKALSKLKENKEKVFTPEKCDKSWFSDNDAHHVTSPCIGRTDPNISMLSTFERSHARERSVESCSSRIYGSREGSTAREIDFTGFDSASLSGYESDLPRTKVHRSRSRIKTNPWLPSPQMSGGTRSEHCQLRESTEDIEEVEDLRGRVPRSASFEYQRGGKMLLQTKPKTEPDRGTTVNQRPRSLTPSDNKMVFSINHDAKSTTDVLKPSWWTVNLQCGGVHDLKDDIKLKEGMLNDLSSDAPKSRPNSTVSPNSEFVMLADNLEQLANNISFEYEEMLDTTLESVSIFQEDGQASIQELLTDEENESGDINKTCQKSDGDIQSAHSPDSGIGGLGSTDGDDTLISTAQMEHTAIPMERRKSSRTEGAYCNAQGSDQNVNLLISGEVKSSDLNTSMNDFETLPPPDTLRSIDLTNSGDFTSLLRGLKHNKPIYEDTCNGDGNSSSATLSESDIDNTSYQGITNMSYHHNNNITYQGINNFSYHGSNTTRHPGTGNAAFKENAICVSNSDKKILLSCESQPDKSINNATLMVNERLDIQFQPCHRQIHGTGIVMGTGRSLHEHTVAVSMKQMPGKMCGLSGATPRRNPRPCTFKGNTYAQEMPRRMNDIEKTFSQVHQRGSWPSDFDFPRNITNTECVESPTENWQCDDQFYMNSCQASAILSPQIAGMQPAGRSRPMEDTFDNSTDCIDNVELVVKLEDDDAKDVSRRTDKVVPETISHMDCSLDNSASGSHGIICELSDACVQTEFDDDFSRWDEADPLESLEERALDPAESTRLWLLTGNMQGSADTGYSSLTRDSQIIMDEDSLLLAGELEERAAAERLSYGESSSKDNSNTTPSNSAYLKIYSRDVSICPEKQNVQQKEINDNMAEGKHSQRSEEDRKTHKLKDKEYSSTNLSSKCLSTHEKTPVCSRSIPHGTITRIFSNIESQFQEIYKKISHDKRILTSPAQKSSSSDSSDNTLKSSDSYDFDCGARHKNSVEFTKTKDSETGETKVCLRSKSDNGLYADIDYVDILSAEQLNATIMQNKPKGHSHINGRVIEDQANKYLRHESSKSQVVLQVSSENHTSNTNHWHASAAAPVSMLPSTERADYLEFLKDAPLSRSHLKRPLFLVPGLGPVDMSRPEQINLFAESEIPVDKNSFYNSFAPSTSAVPSMSPSTAHCGKKIKYKKGEHISSIDHTSSQAEITAGIFSNPALPLSQSKPTLPHGRPDIPTNNMFCNENPQGVSSVFSSNCRYSRSKAPYMRQSGDTCSGISSQNSQQVIAHSQHSNPAFIGIPREFKTSDGKKVEDEATRSLREKVMSLRREKDAVFQKIQEARQDEKLRTEQRMQIQKNMHAQRKEALLETLHELKNKLEEQSKLLKQREASSMDS